MPVKFLTENQLVHACSSVCFDTRKQWVPDYD